MAERGRIFTGARARFKINGVIVGYARSVNGRERVVKEPVKVIGNIRVAEHVPVAYEVEFSASMFRIVGETLKSLGWFPAVGDNPEDHLNNILLAADNPMVATIEDSKTGRILYTVGQVEIQDVNWTLDAQGLVGRDVTFVAITMKDESEIV